MGKMDRKTVALLVFHLLRSQKFVSEEDKTGRLGTEVPQRVQGQNPGGGLVAKPQKLKTYSLTSRHVAPLRNGLSVTSQQQQFRL